MACGRFLIFGLLVLSSATRCCSEDDWNLWRGPNCNGTVLADGYFSDQPFGLEVLWNNNVGSAYSGVSIVDQRVLTMLNDGKSDYVASLELLTGQEIWRYRIGDIYKAHDGGHDGPVSTPVADHHHVYALGPRGRLIALDFESGNEVWSVGLRQKFGAENPFWGIATTPILFEDLVIVQANGERGHGIIAFDKATGDHRWHCALGRTEYRSPILAKVNKKYQVIASGHSKTIGVDPSNGKVLWRYNGGIANDKTPVHLGDGKILLVKNGCELIQLDKPMTRAKRLWRSPEFRGNYDVPAFHEGYLFGFTGRYLTCIEAETGKRVWRSRRPGGKGLIIVDGHLIVLGDHGDLVVAEAKGTGYIEKSRINVSDGAAYSWPSFADQTIVVRNLKHIVALKPTVAPLAPTTKTSAANQFQKFVTQVESSNEKTKLLNEFLSRQKVFPIIENEKFVHFIYRGQAMDVGIQGTMLAMGEQDSMFRISGTDCFYRTYEIKAGANWQYQFIVDFDREIPDPANPRRTFDDPQVSELVTESWAEPEFAIPYEGNSKGQLKSFQFKSSRSSLSGEIKVYLPHNYRADSAHSLVVVLDGNEWISKGRLPNTLDHILESRDDTPVVAFAHRSSEGRLGGWQTKAYSQSLVQELIPQLTSRYRIDNTKAKTILGHRGGAVTAVFAALSYPDIFDSCIAISYGRADTVRSDAIRHLIHSSKDQSQRFHIAWNRYEVWRPQSFDCREQSKLLADSLQGRGYEVSGGQDKTGYGFRSWRAQAGNALMQVLD